MTGGVDPSVNSTGVAVLEPSGFWHFFIITGHLTKKQAALGVLTFSNCTFEYVLYNKEEYSDMYYQKEAAKARNMSRIADCVKTIIEQYGVTRCGMEGISYGSISRSSAIYDLAGLNYLIRDRLSKIDLRVITPSDNKKFATGKGNATKEVMSRGFEAVFPQLIQAVKKIDDIADAYWLTLAANMQQD